mgnify:CR=1 FL=1
MYVVVPTLAVLITEGLHVPVMPFVDVVAKVAGVAPTQYGPSAVNVGAVSVCTAAVTGTRALLHPAPCTVQLNQE